MITTILRLSYMAVLPIIVSALLYLADKKQIFKGLNYYLKQVIIGIIFGIVAVLCSEFSVDIGGADANIRDTSPICAGLIFGGPSGIIAGIIGGVERYIAVYWGAGTYTRFACSCATVFSGIFAALIRKFMFDNKKPSWFFGFAVGFIMEILHMLIIFFTNTDSIRIAFNLVELCSLPMILVNSISVMLSIWIVTLIGRDKVHMGHKKRNVSYTFQRRMFICAISAFLVTTIFSWDLQTRMSEANTLNILTLNIQDVKQDILEASDENLLNISHSVANEINLSDEPYSIILPKLSEKYNIAEINIVNDNGIIEESTNKDFIGYNMKDGKQSSEFLALLNDIDEYVQNYQSISIDTSISRKYAGVALDGGGFLQIGYNAEQFQKDISKQVIGVTRNRHIGENGSIIICDENWNIVSDRNRYEGQSISKTGIWIDTENIAEGQRFKSYAYGKESYCAYMVAEGYYIIAIMPQSEAVFSRNISIYITMFMEVVIFAFIFGATYLLTKKMIIDSIKRINLYFLENNEYNIYNSNYNNSDEEFISLSDDIDSSLSIIETYIKETEAKISKETEFAKFIQHSALPASFALSSDYKDFDIYAQLYTAKEVGGDFYDFYMIGEDNLAFMIADVSGSGISSAMFILKAKALIKNLAETKIEVNDIFTLANEELCANNDAGMFVSAWLGILNLETGLLSFVNAGHSSPIIYQGEGFSYMEKNSGLVLAGKEGVKYDKIQLRLAPKDRIFLYTDGLTEAVDKNNNSYGKERLIDILNQNSNMDSKGICEAVKQDVDNFVLDASQFDDITMLCIKYKP